MTTTFKGSPIELEGSFPTKGNTAPAFGLVANNLQKKTLDDFKGKKKVLNVFPSIDTSVCATSVRTFNKEATSLENTVVLCISKDLPFAQGRFCGAEGLENVITLSAFNSDFGKNYGLLILNGPLAGLLARAVIVLNENDKVVYEEIVSEITSEPNYTAALNAIKV